MSTQALAYTNLFGVMSTGTLPPGAAAGVVACGPKGETRVVAGDSAASLLYNKVNGTEDCGVRMPDGKPPLAAADIATFKAWIDQGALNN
jgi:hypothetical protein